MNLFDRLFQLQFTWRDAADIIVVAIVIYYILALIRGTRAMQISIGLVLLVSTFFVARAFDLPALEAVSRQILFYLPFAIIVLFQQEIRRGLASIAGNPLALMLRPRPGPISHEAVLDACDVLSAKGLGALIVIEGRQTLPSVVESAKALDALVNTDLLVSIFTPGGPLHDGAVIIRGNRIVAANAFLPLTAAPDPGLTRGTRHRAAIGLSEDSDAIVIVISEEDGSMALASEGTLREKLDRTTLEEILTARFGAGR
jgi:diadenylate cyclase